MASLDDRMTPFVRNLLILAAVAAAIVALNAETALATAGTLLRFAFVICVWFVVILTTDFHCECGRCVNEA